MFLPTFIFLLFYLCHSLDLTGFKKFIAHSPDVIQVMESVLARHAWNPLDHGLRLATDGVWGMM